MTGAAPSPRPPRAEPEGTVATVTEFVYLRPLPRSGMLTLAEAGKVADSLRNGSLAVLPTETGHMLAALATNLTAVESAFTVKGRVPANVMHVACASLQMAEQVGAINDLAVRLLGDLTPGPVTVVVEKTPLLPDRLVTLDGTVGIRVPDHPATLQVINAVGAPVTATSLNSSGSAAEPLGKLDLQALNWPESGIVYIVKDDDAIAYSTPSTLVRIRADSLEILRQGPVPETEIRRIASLG
jgi:L-threonylcarbamoyladenylate synthase